MNERVEPLTAKQKLALSRAELLSVMGYQQINEAGTPPVVQIVPEPAGSTLTSRLRSSVLGHWWRGHPIHAVVTTAEPALKAYASQSPGKVVAYAACAGGLLVLLKPWKLLSVGAIVTLLLKSSDIADLVRRTLDPPGFDTSREWEPDTA